jgi:hypothetical protein
MTLFTAAKRSLLVDEIDWLNGTIKCALIKGYTQNIAHTYVSDVVNAGAILASETVLTDKAISTSGNYTAQNVTMSSSPNDIANSYYLLLYQSSAPTGGADLATSTQRLITYFNTGGNLPVQPVGGVVSITWGIYILRVL